MLVPDRLRNLFTKPWPPMAGGAFSFCWPRLHIRKRRARHGRRRHVRWTIFNREPGGERHRNRLAPRLAISWCRSAIHCPLCIPGIEMLDRVKPGAREVVCLHVRILAPSASGEHEFDADHLFGSMNNIFCRKPSLAKNAANRFALVFFGVAPTTCGTVLLAPHVCIVDHRGRNFSHWQRRRQARKSVKRGKTAGRPNRNSIWKCTDRMATRFTNLGQGGHAPNLTAND